MALDPETIQGLVAAAITGVVGSGGWLVSKLWQMYRHEIKGMKDLDDRILELLDRKMEADSKLHIEMHGTMQEIKGYLAADRRVQ